MQPAATLSDSGAKPLLEAIARVFVCWTESSRTNCCHHQEKLLESHSQMTESALTEDKRVEFEHLVGQRRRQLWPVGRGRKFAHTSSMTGVVKFPANSLQWSGQADGRAGGGWRNISGRHRAHDL